MREKAARLLPLTACGVYIWWRGDQPLYIGSAVSMLARIGRHHVIGTAEPIEADDEIEFRECASHKDALKMEADLIKGHRPIFNKSGNPDWLEARRREKEMCPRQERENRDRDGIYTRKGCLHISFTNASGRRVQRKLKGTKSKTIARQIRNAELAKAAESRILTTDSFAQFGGRGHNQVLPPKFSNIS